MSPADFGEIDMNPLTHIFARLHVIVGAVPDSPGDAWYCLDFDGRADFDLDEQLTGIGTGADSGTVELADACRSNRLFCVAQFVHHVAAFEIFCFAELSYLVAVPPPSDDTRLVFAHD